MNNRNVTCSLEHVNDVNHEESPNLVLYNLKVIKDICKKSRNLQEQLGSKVRVFVNQLIVKRSGISGDLKIVQSTINKDRDRQSITTIPRSNALGSIVPHYLFLIGIENYGIFGNGHAVAAIVRDEKLYIFNPSNTKSGIYRSHGDVISEKSMYRKVYELLRKMIKISNVYVYTGKNLQARNNLRHVDYSISCTLFSEHFLLHPTLYKTLVPDGFTMGRAQDLFDRISFTENQVRERTKLLPKKYKSPSFDFGGLRFVQKRKRSRSHTSHRLKKRYKR
jgi:hypothetical protein